MAGSLVKNLISLDYEDIIDYNFPLDEAFQIEVMYNNVQYDFIIRLSSKNKNLLSFGSAAFPRDKLDKDGNIIQPPYLNRWSWYKFFEESFIAYADSTFYLDDEIALGWYVGGKDWCLEKIADIIEKICINQNITNDNILFFGSSGGGFSSIGLATLLKDSKALVQISSFSVKDITDSHYGNLMKVLKKEFPDLSEEEITQQLVHRLDLIDLFKKEEYVPEIVYYVNVNSERDLNERCIPFTNRLLELPFYKNDFVVHFYKDDDPYMGGHVAIETGKMVKIIKYYSRIWLYNNQNKPELIEMDKKYNDLSRKNKKKIKKLEQENKKLKKENKKFKSSKSWKLTAPFRKLFSSIKKLLK